MDQLTALFPAEPVLSLLLALISLLFAYTVFNLVGFGTGLVAGAPLAQLLPVSRVIPLLAVLDFGSAAARAWQHRQRIAYPELRRLLPGMLIGQSLGVFLLSRLAPAPMACLLGIFVIVQGIRGLRPPAAVLDTPSGAWPSAILGGVLGGLFGSGGFMYASYLTRRLEDREAFRATQAILIGLSTAWRIVLCAATGLLDLPLLLTALLLLPAVPAGHWLARRIDLRLSRRQLDILLNLLLLAAGALLIWRQWQT